MSGQYDPKVETLPTSSRFRFQTFSIKSLLLLTTLIAVGIFLVSPATVKITIPHDEGAWLGGVPKIGDEIDIYPGFDKESPWIVEGGIVVNSPEWIFREGIAMKLDVRMKRYQAWPIRNFDFCRIVKKQAEQSYSL